MFDVHNITLKILELISNYILFIPLKKIMFYLLLLLAWFCFCSNTKLLFLYFLYRKVLYNLYVSKRFSLISFLFFKWFPVMKFQVLNFFLVFWWVWTHQSIKLTGGKYKLHRTKTNPLLQFLAILLFFHTYFK